MKLYSALSDFELTVLMKQDDEGAFTEIYHRYSRKLLAIGYNYSKNSSSSEEIVQEVFIGLWERRKAVNIESLSAYLATAVKFSVFKTLQRQKRREEIAKLNYKVETNVLDEEKIHAKFLQEYVDGIVEKLPLKCRLVYQYSRNQHLSNAEISEKINIATKTVEAHLTKALRNVREGLDKIGLSAFLVLDLLSEIFN